MGTAMKPKQFQTETDGARLCALLKLPIVDKALREEEAALIADRRSHVAEIAKLSAAELDAWNAAETDTHDALTNLRAAQAALAQAEATYSSVLFKKNSNLQSLRASREVHESALIASAPATIDEFIREAQSLYDWSLGYLTYSQILGTKKLISGHKFSLVRSNAPAADAWRQNLRAIIQAAKNLKFEPDIKLIENRIEELRGTIGDPNKLDFVEVKSEVAYILSSHV